MPWKTFSDYRGTGWNAEWFVGLSVGLLDSPRKKMLKFSPIGWHIMQARTPGDRLPLLFPQFSAIAKSKSILVIESCYTNHP